MRDLAATKSVSVDVIYSLVAEIEAHAVESAGRCIDEIRRQEQERKRVAAAAAAEEAKRRPPRPPPPPEVMRASSGVTR